MFSGFRSAFTSSGLTISVLAHSFANGFSRAIHGGWGRRSAMETVMAKNYEESVREEINRLSPWVFGRATEEDVKALDRYNRRKAREDALYFHPAAVSRSGGLRGSKATGGKRGKW